MKCSFIVEEMVSFAQLGVIMDGSFQGALLHVRGDFCGREGREYGLAQRRCQLLCTEQRTREATYCPLGLAHVQPWLLLTRRPLVLADIPPTEIIQMI